jgi:hypothetical protein
VANIATELLRQESRRVLPGKAECEITLKEECHNKKKVIKQNVEFEIH